jgi:hypothetical protein
MTMSLDSKYRGIFSGRNRFDYLLIEQNDGIKDGIALTQDGNGNQILNYLTPSDTFDIINNSFAEYAVPVLRLDGSASTNTNNSTNYAGAGFVALLFIGIIVKHDLEKGWKVVK